MGTTDNNNWTRVQQSVREAERLIGQKQYNLAMIKSRQALEFMVNCLGEKALIVDGDLADSIDQLFEGHWISQATKDHYHRIRVLGNKAVHDGNDSPYDANEAYQLLSQEAAAFADIYSGRRRSTTPVSYTHLKARGSAVGPFQSDSEPTVTDCGLRRIYPVYLAVHLLPKHAPPQ